MIKKDGVELMNARTANVKIARSTIEICKNKQYTSINGVVVDLAPSLDPAILGTVLYKDPLPKKDYISVTPIIEVVNETTTQAAIRLQTIGKQKLVALNFASARNQGGGFLSGAIAQEEDLCRKSGLYSCLKRKPMFYNDNIMCDDPYYTNNILYSPEVPFFRDDHNLLIDPLYKLSIISAPAPNLNGSRPEGLQPLLKGLILERAIKILEIAGLNGHKNIILGAWGCGAFGNNPIMVSEAFKLALKKVPVFEHVCFAVYDTKEPTHLFNSFQKTFKGV